MRTRVFVGIGSNMDRPKRHVRQAMEDLAALPSTRLAGRSSLYRTSPVGPRNQSDFVNAVAELDTALAPLVLLGHLRRIERRHGRVRVQHWGRRTLDLDLLLYGSITLNHPRLSIPHPRMHERLFVLAPLRELRPELAIPGRGRVAALAEGLSRKDRHSVRRV